MKPYTCADYRQEMVLAGLRKQLAEADLNDNEKKKLEAQIRKIEEDMGLS